MWCTVFLIKYIPIYIIPFIADCYHALYLTLHITAIHGFGQTQIRLYLQFGQPMIPLSKIMWTPFIHCYFYDKRSIQKKGKIFVVVLSCFLLCAIDLKCSSLNSCLTILRNYNIHCLQFSFLWSKIEFIWYYIIIIMVNVRRYFIWIYFGWIFSAQL